MSEVPQEVIDRVLSTYKLMTSTSHPAVEDASRLVVTHLDALWDAGERDAQRLTVSGLAYLRELNACSEQARSRSRVPESRPVSGEWARQRFSRPRLERL